MWYHASNKGIVASGVVTDRHDTAAQERGEQFLSIDAKLQYAPAHGRRRPRFSESAPVHHAKDGFARQRQQQTVAMRDHDIELAIRQHQSQDVPEIPHRQPTSGPRVHE